MSKTSTLTLFLFFTLSVLFAATAQDTTVTKAYIQFLEERIQRLESTTTGATDISEKRLDFVEKQIGNLQTESQVSSGQLSNQLAASSRNIDIWGYILTIFGIGIAAVLGWFQFRTSKNLAENKVILSESKTILEKQEKAKNEVLEIQAAINRSLDDVYQKLQLKEADYLIKLLEREPGDISNVESRLIITNLTEEHYQSLRKIVDKPDVDENSYLRLIVKLMIYKFPTLWLEDSFMKERLIVNYYPYLTSLFDYDRIALLKALSKYLKKSDANDQDLTAGAPFLLYHCGYNYDIPSNSDFKVKVDEWFRDFYNELEYKSLRFRYLEKALELYNDYYDSPSGVNRSIPSGANKLEMIHNIISIYGKHLIVDYKDDVTNTPEQQDVLKKINANNEWYEAFPSLKPD